MNSIRRYFLIFKTGRAVCLKQVLACSLVQLMLIFFPVPVYAQGDLLRGDVLSTEGQGRPPVGSQFSSKPPESATTQQKIALSASYGLNPVSLKAKGANVFVDASATRFVVANSRNENPTAEKDCKTGTLATNPYPLSIYDMPAVSIRGGLFDGRIPLQSDWRPTYCNSSAISIYRSTHPTIESVRTRGTWDALRFLNGSENFEVTRSWISTSRDDCLENDYLLSGIIKDSLFDGCFMGISAEPYPKSAASKDPADLKIDRLLLRITPFSYNGVELQGTPFKFQDNAINVHLFNSVILFEASGFISRGRVERMWQPIIECRNNLLLWPSSETLPRDMPSPPSCFRVITGSAARTFWEKALQNWINCHPELVHFEDDPRADPASCVRNLE